VRGTVSRRDAGSRRRGVPPAVDRHVAAAATDVLAGVDAIGFSPERIDHVEIAAEQPLADDILVGVRAFRQEVSDQIVDALRRLAAQYRGSRIGHYYLGSSGDVDVRGWARSLSRTVATGIRASIDYTQSDAQLAEAVGGNRPASPSSRRR